MELSIGGIWHKNDVNGSPPKCDRGAIYGEMLTLAPVMLNAVTPKELINSSFRVSVEICNFYAIFLVNRYL